MKEAISPSTNLAESQDREMLSRLQRLSDGIYMLAMVLMVLQFDLPDLTTTFSEREATDYLLSQLPALQIYAGTFILICFYWQTNLNQFKHFHKTDSVHLWLNLLTLMFVVIIPYANDLSTVYPGNAIVQIFYSADLMCVGLLSFASWCYAANGQRLVDLDSETSVFFVGLEVLIEPFVCAITIAVALIDPAYWEISFYLIVPLYIGLNFWERRSHARLQKSLVGKTLD